MFTWFRGFEHNWTHLDKLADYNELDNFTGFTKILGFKGLSQ